MQNCFLGSCVFLLGPRRSLVYFSSDRFRTWGKSTQAQVEQVKLHTDSNLRSRSSCVVLTPKQIPMSPVHTRPALVFAVSGRAFHTHAFSGVLPE